MLSCHCRVNVTTDRVIEVCYPFPPEYGHWYPRVVVMTKFLALYAIPLSLIATFYLLMARRLFATSRRVVGGLNSTHAKQMELRTKVAKMVLALTVTFAISFLPSHVRKNWSNQFLKWLFVWMQIFMLWFHFTYPESMDNYNSWWHALKITGYILTFANSALNPVVLYFISGKFRGHFKACLGLGSWTPRRDRVLRHGTATGGTWRAASGGVNTFYCYSASIKSTSIENAPSNSTRL